MRIRIAHGFLVSALALMAAHAAAQPYPSRPIKFIVPVPAGGATDVLARSLVNSLQPLVSVPVVVDNRAGASGMIGVSAVARAPADGYTLVVTAPDAITVLPNLKRDMPYQADKELQAITLLADLPMVVAVSGKSPYNSLAELIAAAKANPGTIKFSSSGIGTSVHLTGELFAGETGTKLLHVPYKGAAPAMQALIAGDVDMFFAAIASMKPFIDSGQIRPLAVAAHSRSAVLPSIPTTAELGYPEMISTIWIGVFGPAGMPRPVVEKANELIVAAMRTPGFTATIKTLGAESNTKSLDDFTKLAAEDRLRWKKVVEKAAIKLDD